MIRQRSAKLAHSKTASKLDEATVNPISPNAAATVDQLSILSYNQHQHSPQVPITIILIILIGYIAIGTVIFALWENWSIVDGAYFCFVTLSTIGFGDLMPTKTFHGPEIQLFACCVYLVLGLVLVAMSFSLLETQLLWKCRRMAVRLKLTAD